MRRWSLVVSTMSLLLLGVHDASARTIVLDVERADVEVFTPESEELGNYYAFRFEIPQRLPGETLMGAYLEFYVDASTDVDALAGGGAVTLEVFPIRSALTDDLDPSQLRPASMKQTVRVGESRHVRVNITDHVRYLLEHDGENLGLAVGSLTGQRLGRFTVRQDSLGQGVVARVTVEFHTLGGPEGAAP